MTPEQKQLAYAAKRAAHTGITAKLIDYRITLPSGDEKIERLPGLIQAATYYPTAIRIERVDATGGFW